MTGVRGIIESRSLPKVAHTRPCRECPFRRVAPAGYLGGGTAEEWTANLTFGDTAFVCHVAEMRGKRHYCAGSMIHMKNSLKTPRDPAFAEALGHYERDAATVFEWPREFHDHHANSLLAETVKEEKKR